MSRIRFSGLCASSMGVAVTLLGAIALAPGCSGSSQSGAEELAEQQDVQSDTAPLACEVKWEERRPSPKGNLRRPLARYPLYPAL